VCVHGRVYMLGEAETDARCVADTQATLPRTAGADAMAIFCEPNADDARRVRLSPAAAEAQRSVCGETASSASLATQVSRSQHQRRKLGTRLQTSTSVPGRACQHVCTDFMQSAVSHAMFSLLHLVHAREMQSR
jgi:hypothetical protein